MSNKMTLMIAASTLVISTQVSGHANYVPKDNLDTYTGRAYKEGSSAYMNLNIAHGCKSDAGYLATRSVSIVFPNTEDLMSIAYTSNHGGDLFGGNAIMSIKPRVTRAFRKIKLINGDVPEFNDHGLKTRDVRGIHWKRGWIPNDKYEVLEFRAKLPKLESTSCVKKLRVYTPVVQYCTHDHKLAWVKAPTALFGEEVISPNYAPYFDVIRDEANNPLPAGCTEDSMEMEVYPSDNDIDTYLAVHQHQKPSGHPDGGDNDNGGGHINHGGDNDNGGGHMNHGGDNDNGGGHMNHGGDNDNGGSHMNHGGDNDNGGSHMNHGGDNDNGGGDMNHGGDNDNGGGHMNHGGDNDNGGGHMNHVGDNDNGGGHDHMNHGGDNDNTGGHGDGMIDGDTANPGEPKPLSESELRGKANYVEYGCAASSCHGSDPAMNEKNVLAGSDHVFFMATLDRVPEMQAVKARLGDDHRTMLDINDYLASFKK